MKINKKFKVSLHAPFNERDKEIQTYGCRAITPDACRNNGVQGVCTLTREDCICIRRPTRAWKKKYNELNSQ